MKIRGASSPNRISLKTLYQSLLDKIKKLVLGSKSVKSNYLVFLILVGVLLITASWAFLVNLQAAKVEPRPFTALTIEPSSESSSEDLSISDFKVVIDNQENKSMVYRLEIRRNSSVFVEWENIELDQNEQWVREIPFSQFAGQCSLLLFREGEDQPYRQVHIVIP
jgi:hypothetical protein